MAEVLLLVADKKPVFVDRDVLATNVPLILQPALFEFHRGHHDAA